jgi:hypothetical protein
MRTVWALAMLAFGFGSGFVVSPKVTEWRKSDPVALKVAEPLPVKKLPDNFKVTEKQVVEAISEGSSAVKNWEWTFGSHAKAEFVSRTPVADNKVDVVVRVEDTQAVGLFHRKVASWNGLIRLHYEAVVSDKNDTVWFVRSAEQLHSKATLWRAND